MSKVCVCMANGLEEVECLAVVDILRRGGVEVEMVSVSDESYVTGSHQITIKTDSIWEDGGYKDADLLFLPGGMPGTKRLGEHRELCECLKQFAENGKRIAAICAAPSVLGENGCLNGKKATCYPGFEDKLSGAQYVSDGVVTDGCVTTARGLGFAIDLGLELVKLLVSEKEALQVKSAIQYE